MSAHPRDPRTLNAALLFTLREAGGGFLPLDTLGEDLARVQGDLEALEEFGFQLERHPYRGAAYRGPAARLCPDQIEHGLETLRIGRRIAVWNRVGSTSDLAARAATNLANDGLVILAEEQTAGRGQRGRRWSVPPRSSVLMSVLLFPPEEVMPSGPEAARGCAWLTALGAVATAELVADWTGAEARIKWPNDVRIDRRKVAGILVERVRGPLAAAGSEAPVCGHRQGVVIGIGLNGNIDPEGFPDELQPIACSLSMLNGGPLDRSELARDLIRRLDRWYDQVLREGLRTLSGAWRDRSEHLGQRVRLTTPSGALGGRLVDLDLSVGLTLDISGARAGPSVVGDPPGPRLERVGLGQVRTLEA